MLSLPSRERGLKSKCNRKDYGRADVAPFAGAWIEMLVSIDDHDVYRSLPSRERGLKSFSLAFV